LAEQRTPLSTVENERMKDKVKTKEELINKLVELRQRITELEKSETQRKRAESRLKSSEKWLKILFEFAPDAYYLNDSKGNFIDGNKAAEEIIGYKKEELIGKNFLKLKLLPPWQISKAAALLAKNALGQPTGPDEFILNRKDGKQVAVEIRTFPVKIKDQVIILGIARDITQRKRAEEALRESENKYRTIFETTGTATVIIEEDTTISLVNREFEKLSGYSKEELKGKKSWTEFVVKDDLERMKEYHRLRRIDPDAAPKKYEFRFIDRQGNIRNIFLSVDMIPETKKSVASLLDITECKRIEKKLRQSIERLQKTLKGTIYALASTVEMRDPYTAGHQRRVTQLACAIAEEMGLPEEQINGLRLAATIHDIGKIHIPLEILSKPGRLAKIEFEMIKIHPQVGYNILKGIEFPWPVAEIVLQHHEHLDGSGYPVGLSGEKIILEARILGVADAVEAMSSHRPYRPTLGIDKALEEILKKRGILYDPRVVNACFKLFTEKGFKFEQE